MRLYVVRHGRTVENEKNIHQGHTDGTLSPAGKKQAEEVGKRLGKEPIQHVYSSDLGRAKQTTEIVLRHVTAPVTYDERLRERKSGMGGTPRDEIDFDNLPDGHENWDMVRDRARSFLNDLEESPHDNVLVVSHAGFLMHGLFKELGLGMEDKPSNGGLTIVDLDDDTKTLVLDNTSHLA